MGVLGHMPVNSGTAGQPGLEGGSDDRRTSAVCWRTGGEGKYRDVGKPRVAPQIGDCETAVHLRQDVQRGRMLRRIDIVVPGAYL